MAKESNYLKRAVRDAEIVKLCDDGESYAHIGRLFDLTGDTVRAIYHRACRGRSPGLLLDHSRPGLLATKPDEEKACGENANQILAK